MINSLIFILHSLSLQPGEEKWITAPLADSYEHQIVEGVGALTIPEYRALFQDNGLTIKHLEVDRQLMVFKDFIALKEWIRSEMAPQFKEEGNERFVEDYFELMKEKGLIDFQGKIGFPRQWLLILVSKAQQ